MNNNNKAFTVIELIVIMAIISILTLLAVLGYNGYTKEARFTQLKYDARLIQDACERYYLDCGDWPRASDTPYTAEEVEQFTKKIYDKTGAIVTLEPDGKYYDIDFTKLQRYVHINSDSSNFILQNPVGEIYIVERVHDPYAEPPVFNIPQGQENAFDQDSNTYVLTKPPVVITWEGSLAYRKVEIRTYQATIKMYDAEGQQLYFINTANNQMVNSLSSGTSITSHYVIVPAEAVKIEISGNSGRLYEFKVAEGVLPKSVSDITHSSTDYSITLNFTIPTNATEALVYEGITFIGKTTTGTITHKPLFADSEHTYTIYAVNEAGISKPIRYTAKTIRPEVIFYGPSIMAFDHDFATNHRGSVVITWDGSLANRQILISAAYASIRMYDAQDNQLYFINMSDNKIANTLSLDKQRSVYLIVPENAVKITVSDAWGYTASLYEIQVVDFSSLPGTVTNITHTATDCSITLNFTLPDDAIKAVVYDGNNFAGETTTGTLTHKPLFADSEHNYTIYAVNNAGISKPIQYTARTIRPEVVFYGPSPVIFDHDLSTRYSFYSSSFTITWDGSLANKQILINGSYISVKVYDAQDNQLYFMNVSKNTTTNNLVITDRQSVYLIIPENAAKIIIGNYVYTGQLYEIEVVTP